MFRSLQLLLLVGSAASLPVLQWGSCTQSYVDKGYHHCAEIEFCVVNATGTTPEAYAYRLPGDPCQPAQCPIIRTTAGKKYLLTLHNKGWHSGRHKANIHTHGPHVIGDGNSDDVTRFAKPGYKIKYTWTFQDNHQGGTFWYHDHVHHYTYPHVSGGAFGMLIMEDITSGSHSAFKSINFNKDVMALMRNELLLIASRVGNVWLGNGRTDMVLNLKAGDWHRLRLVGVNPEAKNGKLLFGDGECQVHLLANDGVWANRVPMNTASESRYEVSGASRRDFAIRCPKAGTYPIEFHNGQVAVLKVVQTSSAASTATPFVDGKPWSSYRPTYLQDLRKVTPAGRTTFKLSADAVNDIPWNHDVPLKVLPYNTVQEFVIEGSDGHPFHLHVYHMQVVTKGGCGPHKEGEWYDVISANGGECRVRVPLYDYGGRVVLHCHVVEHEDNGAMGWVKVSGPGVALDMQDVDAMNADESSCGACDHKCGQVSGENKCGSCRLASPICSNGKVCNVDTMKCVDPATNPDSWTTGEDDGVVDVPTTPAARAAPSWTLWVGIAVGVGMLLCTAVACAFWVVRVRRISKAEAFLMVEGTELEAPEVPVPVSLQSMQGGRFSSHRPSTPQTASQLPSEVASPCGTGGLLMKEAI